MNHPSSRPVLSRFGQVASAVVLVVGVSGCVSDVATGPTAQTFWTATLDGGIEWPDVQGSASVISSESFAEAGLLMSGLPVGSYAWRVRAGTCDAPGDVVGGEGQYPDLEVDADPGGDGASATMVATPRFRAGMDPAGVYHVDVRAPDDRLACGDLVRQ